MFLGGGPDDLAEEFKFEELTETGRGGGGIMDGMEFVGLTVIGGSREVGVFDTTAFSRACVRGDGMIVAELSDFFSSGCSTTLCSTAGLTKNLVCSRLVVSSVETSTDGFFVSHSTISADAEVEDRFVSSGCQFRLRRWYSNHVMDTTATEMPSRDMTRLICNKSMAAVTVVVVVVVVVIATP